MTNEDILKGKVKQAEGRAEKAYGDLTDDPEHMAHGDVKRAEGSVQEGVGHIKEAIADAVKNSERAEAAGTGGGRAV
jgi:uncharacterized protein YjbJ (UPF0337 family)